MQPTVCGLSRVVFTGYLRVGGRGSAWEQEKLEARKMLENAVDFPSLGAQT